MQGEEGIHAGEREVIDMRNWFYIRGLVKEINILRIMEARFLTVREN